MIIDLQKFIDSERSVWNELESFLNRMENDPNGVISLEQIKRFHYLYQRTSADLAKIKTFSSERQITQYLETMVARAYGEIHESRKRSRGFSVLRWFFVTFPQVFRKHIKTFVLALLIMTVGGIFGAFAIVMDTDAKAILIPFGQLHGNPSERVKSEEKASTDRLKGKKATFSSYLMTHNTKVSMLILALGMTYGIGTVIMLFYNGVILGAVCIDYVIAGESQFLAGWLLPHGVIEIPAILIAGQASLLLANALIGWGRPVHLKERFRLISSDLITLIFGVGLMLIWAGIVEGYLSQYHQPTIPYWAKIGFGLVELIILTLFLAKSGKLQPLNERRQ